MKIHARYYGRLWNQRRVFLLRLAIAFAVAVWVAWEAFQ
jgi:hypothetical protein